MKIISNSILGICLLATVSAGAQVKKAHSAVAVAKPTINAPAPATSPAYANSKVMTEEEFLKNFPEVKHITWAPGAVATIEKADGSKERYSLDRFDDEKKFVGIYGKILRQTQPPATGNN